MDEFRQLNFSDADRKLYGRLSSAIHNLYFSLQYGEFILKKGWKAKPWSRGTTYLQQSAFVTAMLVSYGRAFGESKKYAKFPTDLLAAYSPEELVLHKKFIKLRHEVYAHTDATTYSVIPFASEHFTDISYIPHYMMDHVSISNLIEMCRKLVDELDKVRADIKARY